MTNKSNERRGYYRIKDTVGLSYSIIEDGEASPDETPAPFSMPLTSLFAEIDREFNQVSNTLWRENPSIAQAMGLLNKKISMVAAMNLQEDDQLLDPYDEMIVSISGTGIAFNCDKNLATGTRLQLSIVLKPSNTSLAFSGDVVGCEMQGSRDDENVYWVRVNIDEGNNAVHEQLIQHVVQKQSVQNNDAFWKH